MFAGSGHVCLATRSATCVLVAVTNTGVLSEAPTTTTLTSVLTILGASVETGLELHCTTFPHYGNIPRILSSMKLVSGRMLTASLSTMWNVRLVRESPMQTWKSIFPMRSIEPSEAGRGCTFPATCRCTMQCSGKNALPIKFGCGPVFNKHSIQYSVWLCIPTEVDTN